MFGDILIGDINRKINKSSNTHVCIVPKGCYYPATTLLTAVGVHSNQISERFKFYQYKFYSFVNIHNRQKEA